MFRKSRSESTLSPLQHYATTVMLEESALKLKLPLKKLQVAEQMA